MTGKVGRAVLAMNVLGDDWVVELAKHPPDTWPGGARKAYGLFSSWLWDQTVTSPSEDAYGRIRAEGWQLETFRRMLPPFEVFQAWHNREEHQGGLRARVEAEAARAKAELDARKFEEETGLPTTPEAWE